MSSTRARVDDFQPQGENCRRDKRKCDGARPICSTCSHRSFPESCVYEKPGGRKSKIELLERRLAELEGRHIHSASPLRATDGQQPQGSLPTALVTESSKPSFPIGDLQDQAREHPHFDQPLEVPAVQNSLHGIAPQTRGNTHYVGHHEGGNVAAQSGTSPTTDSVCSTAEASIHF